MQNTAIYSCTRYTACIQENSWSGDTVRSSTAKFLELDSVMIRKNPEFNVSNIVVVYLFKRFTV